METLVGTEKYSKDRVLVLALVEAVVDAVVAGVVEKFVGVAYWVVDGPYFALVVVQPAGTFELLSLEFL